jgi:hypothetical protein
MEADKKPTKTREENDERETMNESRSQNPGARRKEKLKAVLRLIILNSGF